MMATPQIIPVSFPVYHGSYTKIEQIDLSKGREHRDFGRGFYVTKFRRHAETWAGSICKSREKQEQAIVTEFEYRDNSFTQHICKKKFFDNYNEEWLDFVVLNRNTANPEPAHDYDIVEGPVADDKVQNRIKDYLKGEISKVDFLEELKWHEQTHQICFCTVNALQTLELADDTHERKIIHITEPLLEALMLDRHINEMLATDIFFTSNTFTQLADEKTKLYQKPWQDIYEMLKQEQPPS
jgi:hypothetical protein